MSDKGTATAQRGKKKPANPRRKAIGQGWRTTDADERARRGRRAEQVDLRVYAGEPAGPPFGTYTVQSHRGRTCTEVYLDRRDQYGGGPKVRVLWAQGLRANNKVRRVVEPFFSTAGELLGDPVDTLPALERAAAEAGLGRDRLRVSVQGTRWRERRRLMADVAAGKRDLNAD